MTRYLQHALRIRQKIRRHTGFMYT